MVAKPETVRDYLRACHAGAVVVDAMHLERCAQTFMLSCGLAVRRATEFESGCGRTPIRRSIPSASLTVFLLRRPYIRLHGR